LASQKSPL